MMNDGCEVGTVHIDKGIVSDFLGYVKKIDILFNRLYFINSQVLLTLRGTGLQPEAGACKMTQTKKTRVTLRRPNPKQIEAVYGKIDLVAAATSTCACGCSC